MDLKIKNYYVNETVVSHLFTTPKPCNKNDEDRTEDIYRVYGVPVTKTYYTEDKSINQDNRNEKVLTKQTVSKTGIYSNGNYFGERELLSVGSVILPKGTTIEEDTVLTIKIPGVKGYVEHFAGLIYFDC